jgi:hypothetical protein
LLKLETEVSIHENLIWSKMYFSKNKKWQIYQLCNEKYPQKCIFQISWPKTLPSSLEAID